MVVRMRLFQRQEGRLEVHLDFPRLPSEAEEQEAFVAVDRIMQNLGYEQRIVARSSRPYVN